MLLLLAFACKAPCSGGDTPDLDIGTGKTSYESVPEGSTVTPIFGMQGGFHYEVALRGTDLDRRDLDVLLVGTFDGEEVARTELTALKFRCDSSEDLAFITDLHLFPALPYDSADTGYVSDLVRGEMVLNATITETDGRETSAQTTWVLEP